AWALQAGALLGALPPGARVDWALSPEERLGRLAPFARWSAAVPRILDGDLVWLADGYLPTGAFPLAPRVSWRGGEIGGLQAAFVGMVDAATGGTRMYLRAGADPLAESWAGVSRGVVEPAASAPEPLLRAAPYPLELFRVQAQQIESLLKPGTLGSRSSGTAAGAGRSIGWSPDTAGPLFFATYERPGERRLSAVLVGRREEGHDALTIVRLDSAEALPSRGALESRWSRFASFDALGDSIREDGGELEQGPVRLELGSGGAMAYKTHYARRGPARLTIAWVSVASGPERMGAGRTMVQAWNNLLGASVPAIPGSAQTTRLEEARRWLERADSALRAADWNGFGRAWQGLRRALGLSADTVGS
ncbi:MAG: UPF0182 family protein, partial [Gemmatimonadales bacterium]|nr:UPF0182 family protein [Gemmatimonadales bacterium]